MVNKKSILDEKNYEQFQDIFQEKLDLLNNFQ